MLWTVPFHRFDGQNDGPLHPGPVGGYLEPRQQVGILIFMDNPGPGPKLQPPPVGVIHQDQRDPVIGRQVADAEILDIAAKIRVADGLFVQHFQEPGGAAPELYIGPALITVFLAYGRLIESVARLDELRFCRAYCIVSFRVPFETFIGRACPVAGLGGLDRGREGNRGKIPGHDLSFRKGGAGVR